MITPGARGVHTATGAAKTKEVSKFTQANVSTDQEANKTSKAGGQMSKLKKKKCGKHSRIIQAFTAKVKH